MIYLFIDFNIMFCTFVTDKTFYLQPKNTEPSCSDTNVVQLHNTLTIFLCIPQLVWNLGSGHRVLPVPHCAGVAESGFEPTKVLPTRLHWLYNASH